MNDKMMGAADAWTSQVIGAAIEVHRELGPGLLESVYQKCLLHELELQNIPCRSEIPVSINYKGLEFREALRLDIMVDGCLAVELKSVAEVLPVHKAQLLSYMKLLRAPVGLMINFNEALLKDGIHRLYLPH